MDIGWGNNKRVHDVIFHLRIDDGKIWIEWDGVETGIAQDLMEAGIPHRFFDPASLFLYYFN